jgi:hypothetical protein
VAQPKFQSLAVRGQNKFRPHQLFYWNQIHWLPILSFPQWSQMMQSATLLLLELLAVIATVALRLVDIPENGSQEFLRCSATSWSVLVKAPDGSRKAPSYSDCPSIVFCVVCDDYMICHQPTHRNPSKTFVFSIISSLSCPLTQVPQLRAPIRSILYPGSGFEGPWFLIFLDYRWWNLCSTLIDSTSVYNRSQSVERGFLYS